MTVYLKTNEMVGENVQESNLIRDLKSAIENGELTLVYQPILDQSQEIVAIESLLRWYHPDYNFISPERIIQIAEKNKLIGKLGEWILRESCMHMVKLHQLGYDSLRTSVNVTPSQFLEESLFSQVSKILFETGLKSKFLELEITENEYLFDFENIIKKIEQLKKLGVSIAIDDFGTGYSSLEYIHQLPVDRIKIDKSFLTGLNPNDEKTFAIVKTSIYLAEILNLEIIAEGVETNQQYQFLVDHSCQMYQGYYFYKPMGEDDLIKALSESNF